MDKEPTIPGPYIPPQHTESSPLKQNFIDSTRKSFENWLWGWDFSVDGAGSLKTIVVVLFFTTGATSLALLTQVYAGDQRPKHGAVSTDNTECSYIALTVLGKGGHAVDAAVAATMCLGVVNFHITGLGGGGIFLGYNQKKKESFDVINFLPTVPESVGAPTLSPTEPGQTVGVPGFLAGLWAAHQHHGRLPWADLVMPSVHLARNGFQAPEQLIAAAACLTPDKFSEPLMDMLDGLIVGRNLTLIRLAAVLELIATKGPSVFYNGTVAEEIVYSVKTGNGSMSAFDLAAYRPSIGMSMSTKFDQYNVIVPASTFGGRFLVSALEFLQQKDLSLGDHMTNETLRDLADTLYDTLGSLLPDKNISSALPVPAASVVAVMDGDDNYVSIVSGLNTWLGSQLLTESGFLLNNALANGGFDSDGRPISLATPVVVVSDGNVCGQRIVSGAGDARILVQVLTELLVFRQALNVSVEAPRFQVGDHSRSITLEDKHDPTFSESMVNSLKAMPMSVGSTKPCPAADSLSIVPYSSINIITKIKDATWPLADSRGGGDAMLF